MRNNRVTKTAVRQSVDNDVVDGRADVRQNHIIARPHVPMFVPDEACRDDGAAVCGGEFYLLVKALLANAAIEQFVCFRRTPGRADSGKHSAAVAP